MYTPWHPDPYEYLTFSEIHHAIEKKFRPPAPLTVFRGSDWGIHAAWCKEFYPNGTKLMLDEEMPKSILWRGTRIRLHVYVAETASIAETNQ